MQSVALTWFVIALTVLPIHSAHVQMAEVMLDTANNLTILYALFDNYCDSVKLIGVIGQSKFIQSALCKSVRRV